jgi:lipopolysaccharide/colanic/teichoic acid biosynthesis glycosyltransferase
MLSASAFDIAFSFVVLLLTATFMLLFALCVKLTSEGPVYFGRNESV